MAAKITTPHSLHSLVRQVIFAFAISQNFFSAIFHMRVCFLNVKIKFYTEPIYAYNKLFIFVLDSTELMKSGIKIEKLCVADYKKKI